MKQYTTALFITREDAERAIGVLHTDLHVDTDEISYLYKNTQGELHQNDAADIAHSTPAEGAISGAEIGGSIGALAGIATVLGVIPVVGPIFAAGPLVSAIGIGAGALGTATAGAITGAATGGIIGALIPLGMGKEKAQKYEDRVYAGDVMVAVHADQSVDVESVFRDNGATDIEILVLA